MADNQRDILTEDEAALVWSRAAQLQAAAGGDTATPAVDDGGDRPSSAGYALEHVRSAAQEAGIADEYLDVALAALRMERVGAEGGKVHPLARRFLKHPPNTISVRKVIEASPEEVLSAMQSVLPEEPFRLTLTDEEGAPLDGGVLVFDLPGMKSATERGFAFATTDAGLRQLYVSLRPIEGATPSCELTVHGPVTSQNLHFGLGMLLTTLTGSIGAGGLGALGVAIGAAPVGAVAGVVLGVGLGVRGFRALYHASMRRATKALEGLVGAVAVRAKGVW